MAYKKKYPILIVSGNKDLRKHFRSLLADSEWMVVYAENELKGINRIGAQTKDPFSVAVVGEIPSEDAGESFLKQVSSLSPFTQRMIIIPAGMPEALIRCINAGHINACISIPFTDKEFLSRISECRQSFKTLLDREKLRHHVSLQRKQIALAAKRLKKKEENGQRLILNQKIKNAKLRSRRSTNVLSLEKLVDHCEIPREPEAFLNLYQSICTSAHLKLLNMFPGLDGEWRIPRPEKSDFTDDHPPDTGKITERLKQLCFKDHLKENKFDHASPGNVAVQADGHDYINDFFTLTISEDRMTASLEMKKVFQPGQINAGDIIKYLNCSSVCAGLIEKAKMEGWLSRDPMDRKRIVVARGRPPVNEKSARITWHFTSNPLAPGRIKDDGGIDFRDRGKTPFVEKGSLLAEIIPAVEGTDGFDVCGLKIPANAPSEPVLEPGPGTRLSEDGSCILADIDGKPCIDTAGQIRVNEMLVINEDVDFTTGHIHFDGDILVKGTIRPGFKVKGVNLTAGAIEGAKIELSGDLTVIDGIIDTTIRTVGNIHARFINKCEIFGFGNFIVKNEIVDSTLLLGGQCMIPSGSIVTALVSAKRGIDAQHVGSRYSEPASLRIGIDDHADHMIKETEAKLKKSIKKLSGLKLKINTHDIEETRMLQRIKELDSRRKRRQTEIEQARQQQNKFGKRSFPVSGLDQVVHNLKRELHFADDQTIEYLERLEHLAQVRDELEAAILNQEEINLKLVVKKQRLAKIKKQKIPFSKIIVRGSIFKGTRITGPNSRTCLKWDHNNCIIREETSEQPISSIYKMAILNR